MSSILRDSLEIKPAGGAANEFNQCGGVGGAVPTVSGNAGEKQKTRKFSIIESENVPKKGRKEELFTDLNGNEVPLVHKTKSSGLNDDQEMTKPKTNKPKWAHYLKKWVAPEWVPKNIPTLPKSKVKLVSGITDIEPWYFETFNEANPNIELFIKRDDNTGATLTGNKVRKLEFLLSDALENKADAIITCGMATSNHCRTTALACAKLGLECHLLLTSLDADINFDSGNICLAAGAGAKMYQIGHDGIDEKMDSLAAELRSKGKTPYVIPRGGSNAPSIWGYIDAWREMEKQEFFDEITDIVVCSGSGGTGLDLALANYWTGSKKKIHGVRAWGDSAYFYPHAAHSLEEAGITGIDPTKIIDIIDGHVGEGYGKSSVDLRQFCIQALNDSGIVLDRVYTGKSVFGLMKELKNNPSRFRGNKVMWVHTGGMFGFLDKSMDEDLEKFNPIKKNYFN